MSLKAFLQRGAVPGNSRSHMRSKKQERELAGKAKGSLTPRSGAGDYVKGDVRIKGVCRIEAKTTHNASFSVTREMVRKIENAALSATEVPALVIEFNNGAGKKLDELAVIPVYALMQLIENQK